MKLHCSFRTPFLLLAITVSSTGFGSWDWLNRFIPGRFSANFKTLPSIGQNACGKMLATKSIRALAEFPIGDEGKKLVAALDSDIFYQTQPFLLAHPEGFATLLARGVTSFERKIYRSNEARLCWNSGYDIVYYVIKHPDDSQSAILAYRQSKNWGDCGLGMPDRRPLFVFIGVALDSERAVAYSSSSFEGSVKTDSTVEVAIGYLARFISNGLQRRAIFELEEPNQLIFAPQN